MQRRLRRSVQNGQRETRKHWNHLFLGKCVMELRGQSQQFQMLLRAQIKWHHRELNLIPYTYNPRVQ